MIEGDEGGRMPALVEDLALLLVRLHQNPSIADEMRIPFGQDQLHCLREDEGDEAKHSLLLIWDPHILYWPVDAFGFQQHKLQQIRVVEILALNNKSICIYRFDKDKPEVVGDIFFSKSAICRER